MIMADAAMQLRVETVGPQDIAGLATIEQWLAGRSDATPFHRPAWVCAVARGTGQQALFLVARDGTGTLRGILPLNIIHSPLFGRALVSTGFAVDGGILADDAHSVAVLADAAIDLAERHSCPTVELRGGAAPGNGWIVKSGSHVNFTRPLQTDDESELLSIPRKHRAEVRRGLEQDYRIENGQHEKLRRDHYALYQRSVHNLGTPVFPRAMFDQVLDAFGAAADILIVYAGDQPLSSVFTLYHGNSCMPYWQGSDRNARKARSNEVLYFRLMGHARNRGCTIFDFGRSKVGSGPALWKKTWGFEPEPLDYYIHAAPGHEPRDINPLSPQYQRKIAMWKAMPPAIVDRIGPWIARGLG